MWLTGVRRQLHLRSCILQESLQFWHCKRMHSSAYQSCKFCDQLVFNVVCKVTQFAVVRFSVDSTGLVGLRWSHMPLSQPEGM